METTSSKRNQFCTPTKIVIGIASTGRAPILKEMLGHLRTQTRQPDRIIISSITEADYAGIDTNSAPVEVVTTGKGASQQRNRIIDMLAPDEIVVFFDDDFLPCADFLQNTLEIFQENPNIALITGTVLKDGILGLGFSFDEAMETISNAPEQVTRVLSNIYNGYCCNTAVRGAPLIAYDVRFDENLPLYSWLEDVDFSRQLAAYGDLVRASDVRGVHLGVKSGRTSGVRLGYSQVVNPFYLIKKGTMDWKLGLRLATRNTIANIVKSFAPEPHIDRIGRVKGNLCGLKDIALGKADPRRIIDF